MNSEVHITKIPRFDLRGYSFQSRSNLHLLTLLRYLQLNFLLLCKDSDSKYLIDIRDNRLLLGYDLFDRKSIDIILTPMYSIEILLLEKVSLIILICIEGIIAKSRSWEN